MYLHECMNKMCHTRWFGDHMYLFPYQMMKSDINQVEVRLSDIKSYKDSLTDIAGAIEVIADRDDKLNQMYHDSTTRVQVRYLSVSCHTSKKNFPNAPSALFRLPKVY